MFIAELILVFLTAYSTAGALFALIFVTVGMPRVDPLTRQVSIGFRLLILPGAMLFWPLLLLRCLHAKGAP
jgi:hypothetical protein